MYIVRPPTSLQDLQPGIPRLRSDRANDGALGKLTRCISFRPSRTIPAGPYVPRILPALSLLDRLGSSRGSASACGLARCRAKVVIPEQRFVAGLVSQGFCRRREELPVILVKKHAALRHQHERDEGDPPRDDDPFGFDSTCGNAIKPARKRLGHRNRALGLLRSAPGSSVAYCQVITISGHRATRPG
jgi:hypothetical protein